MSQIVALSRMRSTYPSRQDFHSIMLTIHEYTDSYIHVEYMYIHIDIHIHTHTNIIMRTQMTVAMEVDYFKHLFKVVLVSHEELKLPLSGSERPHIPRTHCRMW